MNIKISDGLNVVSIGYNRLGSYFRLKRPVSIVWDDCADGGEGMYLSLIPSSAVEREMMQRTINVNLFEDFTGREGELYVQLKPLFGLLQNGDYQLYFNNGKNKREAVVSSGGKSSTYEIEWDIAYAESVDLSKIEEIKKNYKKDRRDTGNVRYTEGLIGYTTASIYGYIETEDSADFILDGHHKSEAYLKLNINPPCLYITREFTPPEEPEFDVESLSSLLYPWQIRHILDNWDEKDVLLPKLMQNPENRIAEFIRHNDYKEYHDNGKLKHEGFYVYDEPEGLIKEFYESGKQKSEYNYSKGKLVGVWKSWYKSGQLKIVQSFNNDGLLHGERVSYLENGEVLAKNDYLNGVPVEA